MLPLLLLLALLVPGMGGATQAPPSPLARECGSAFAGVKARQLSFRASDGARLNGVLMGAGDAGVVLASEFPSDLCGWADYAQVLVKEGYTVLLFDYRGLGLSPTPPLASANRYPADVAGAARELRRHAVEKVLLVGASLGGAAAIIAAPGIAGVAGVVSLSGETDLNNVNLHALRAAPRLRSPFLVVGSTTDRYLSPAEARSLVRAAGSRDKKLVLYPGSWHGWDLLYAAPYKAKVSATLLGFLERLRS